MRREHRCGTAQAQAAVASDFVGWVSALPRRPERAMLQRTGWEIRRCFTKNGGICYPPLHISHRTTSNDWPNSYPTLASAVAPAVTFFELVVVIVSTREEDEARGANAARRVDPFADCVVYAAKMELCCCSHAK
mmetsp:Transcript_5934/g.15755  ORF Transcript_5934/g.15755 Transcript_5934/m.15755 type:complete len:134 (+) Transcript_5934:111-512(+)